MRHSISCMQYTPRISVVMPVFNTPERYLREAIESIQKQLYPFWELCIVDDCSSDSRVREVILEYVSADPQRITSHFLEQRSGISLATNAAVQRATGEFIGFCDHDDVLREHALFVVAQELQARRDCALIFSDEDRLSPQGLRHKPYFKSGWNPELMLAHNAVCHFMVVSAAVYHRVGGMQSTYNGAQDWDFVFRIAELLTPQQILHIPQILYHWREIPGSTARGIAEKPYVKDAQRRVVHEHLARSECCPVSVESLPFTSMFTPRFSLPTPHPLVSLVVSCEISPSKLEKALACAGYSNIEIVQVQDLRVDKEGSSSTRKLSAQSPQQISINVPPELSIAERLNRGVQASSGEILCFLPSVPVKEEANWLYELVVQVCRKGVGAVGPKVLAANGRIRSAGLAIDATGIAAMYQGRPARYMGDFYRAALARDVAALTGDCLTVRRAVFDRVGGFDDERFADIGYDVDLCLALRAQGLRVICTPRSQIVTKTERASFKAEEFARLALKWGQIIASQHFWSPHLSPSAELGKSGKNWLKRGFASSP